MKISWARALSEVTMLNANVSFVFFAALHVILCLCVCVYLFKQASYCHADFQALSCAKIDS